MVIKLGRSSGAFKSSFLAKRRAWISSTDISRNEGSRVMSAQMTSDLKSGWIASGTITPRQCRSVPKSPDTCTNGVMRCVSTIASTRALKRWPNNRSNRESSAARSALANASVAVTSDIASWAAPCSRPLAAVRSSSLKLGDPSGCLGHWRLSGRSA